MNLRLDSYARITATRQMVDNARKLHPDADDDVDFGVLVAVWSYTISRAETECMMAADDADSTNAWACEVETQAARVIEAAQDADNWRALLEIDERSGIDQEIDRLTAIKEPTSSEASRLTMALEISRENAAIYATGPNPRVTPFVGFMESHRQGRMDCNLSHHEIQAALGKEVVPRPSRDGKCKFQWDFHVDGVPCAIWDYQGARWSFFGPRELLAEIFPGRV